MRQQIDQRDFHPGPCVQWAKLSKLEECNRYKPSCLAALWTHIRWGFNGRTDQLLEATAPPSDPHATSRWQTFPSIRTLEEYYPVIPSVTLLLIILVSFHREWFTKTDFRPWSSYPTSSQTPWLLRFYASFWEAHGDLMWAFVTF